MPNLLEEATATFNEILRMHKPNAELLETLSVAAQWLGNYAKKHDISFPNSSTYESLINKAETLIEEISQDPQPYLTFKKLSDGFSHRKPSDDNDTEPFFIKLLYVMGCAYACIDSNGTRCYDGTK
jgi:hypothetical protein